MPIPSPGIPSATSAISSVELQTTQNNKAFYVYSGLIQVGATDVTMISINDVGKRDILICLAVGCEDNNSADSLLTVKSNGQIIFNEIGDRSSSSSVLVGTEYKFILPANTSLEVLMKSTGVNNDWTVAAYGYYLE